MEEYFSGVYLHDGFVFEPKEWCPFYWTVEQWKKYVDQLHLCGIKMMEFCTQASFLRIPSTDFERRRIEIVHEFIVYAHSKGLKVWLVVPSNVLSTVPKGELPVDQRDAKAFEELCPRDPENRNRLLEVMGYFIEKYKNVDGYELFAGDWGGCGCGDCDYHTWLGLARDYYDCIRKYNKDAVVTVNTWAVGYWRKFDRQNTPWVDVFREEEALAWKVAASMSEMPKDVALTLPFHHLYRPLALHGRTVEQSPKCLDREHIDTLIASGRKVFAWPHFVMENDPYHLGRWGYFNCRVRYIKDVIKRLHERNVSGIIGNLYNPYMQPLSAYAFGILSQNPEADVYDIIRSFAELIACKDDAEKLFNILVCMENNDPWESDLGEVARLPKLECGICAGEAEKLLQSVRPRDETFFILDGKQILDCIQASLVLLSKQTENAGLS